MANMAAGKEPGHFDHFGAIFTGNKDQFLDKLTNSDVRYLLASIIFSIFRFINSTDCVVASHAVILLLYKKMRIRFAVKGQTSKSACNHRKRHYPTLLWLLQSVSYWLANHSEGNTRALHKDHDTP